MTTDTRTDDAAAEWANRWHMSGLDDEQLHKLQADFEGAIRQGQERYARLQQHWDHCPAVSGRPDPACRDCCAYQALRDGDCR